MKKKVLIIIGIIILAIIGVIAYSIISDLQQEENLKTELQELSDLVNETNIDINQVNEKLERTVTKGDYAVVEQAFKQYLKDNFDVSIAIAQILNDERITNILTVENYEEDGKEFIETKNYISTTKEQLEMYKEEYAEFFTEEKIMSYINNKNLDSYYTDFYRQELVGDIESENNDKVVESSIDEILEILDVYEKVINLLSTNANSWQIEGENIVFSSSSLQNQYNQLINELTE